MVDPTSGFLYPDIRYVAPLLLFLVVVSIWMNDSKEKNKYSVSPKVSLICHIINFLLWPFQKFQLREEFRPLELSNAKRYATKKTGLTDFGDWSFSEIAFPYIIELASQYSYSPVGYLAFQDFIIRKMTTRLRINDELKQKSTKEYCDSNPIRQPIFIVGLPRTGTTFLQRLLSLDPANTSPFTWELMDPVPRIKEDLEKDKIKRVKYCQKNIDTLLSLVPHGADIHELGAELPEECMLLMGVDAPMLIFNFHTLLNVQEVFYKWNWSQPYMNYYKGLQIIKHYRGLREGSPDTRRWVLKSPPHLGALDFLTNVFPDARIVWSHRDPKECLPSLSSLVRAGQDLCEGSGVIQLDELGQHMVTYADDMYKRGDIFFDKINEKSSFYGSHVLYKKLLSDPIETVRDLYDDFGYEFTDEYKRNIESYLREDKMKRSSMKGRNGGKVNNYTLEEYGLTKSEVDEKFAWYFKKYMPTS